MLPPIQSFRTRLTLLFGGLSLLIGLGVTLYIDRIAAARMRAAQGEVLQGLAHAVASTLAADIAEREREIALLAHLPLLTEDAIKASELRRVIEKARHLAGEYAWIGIADALGTVRLATDGLLEGLDVGDRPWFVQGRRAIYVGGVHDAVMPAGKPLTADPGEPLQLIDFAAPIRDGEGRLRGVLGAHVQWNRVTEVIRGMLTDAATRAGIEILIADRGGAILYPRSQTGRLQLPASLPAGDGFAVADWGQGGAWLSCRGAVGAESRLGLGWQIVVRQPVAQALATVAELHCELLAIGGIAALLFMALAYRLAGHFSRPVVQLAEMARGIERGIVETPFANPSTTLEIRDLADSLRGMTTTLLRREAELEEANRSLERKVGERTAELAELYDEAPVGYHTADREGVIRQINKRELAMLGYRREEVVDRLHVTDLLAEGWRPLTRERMARLRAGEALPPLDAEMRRKDGSSLPVRLNSTAVKDQQGNFRLARTAVMDVSDLHEIELTLRRQQALNEAIVHASTNGLLLYREDGQCLLANEAAAQIVGASMQDLLQQNFHRIASWRGNGWYEAALAALNGRETQLLVSTRSTFGKPIDSQLTLVPLRHDDRPLVLVVLKDVSELIAANRELERLARRDTLTGLFNRLAANERLREEFLRMTRSGAVYSLLLMDIDHFKRVNDSFGHETGDQALRHVADLLAGESRATDYVFRFGGEEFLVLLPDTDIHGATVLAEKMRAAVAASPVPPIGHVSVSIGASAASPTDANEDEALRRADQALYRAKDGGRNRVEA